MHKNAIRNSFCLIVITMVGALPGCSRDPSAKVAAILKELSGEWKILSLNRAGTISSDAALKDSHVTVKDDQFTLVEIKGPNKGTNEFSVREGASEIYTLQINPAKPEKDIDLAYATGDQIGQVRPGIYSLEGNTVRLCVGLPNGSRPTEFEAGKGKMLIVLERQQ